MKIGPIIVVFPCIQKYKDYVKEDAQSQIYHVLKMRVHDYD